MTDQHEETSEIDDRLLERLRARLTSQAARVTHNRADAEDVVQTAIMRAFERRASLPPATNLSAWMSIVVRRLAIDCARKRRVERPLCERVEEPTVESTEPLPLWRMVSREQLQAALDACGPKLRDAYVLHCQQGLSYSEVARALEIPLRTAGTRIHRARAALRAHLEEALCPGVSPPHASSPSHSVRDRARHNRARDRDAATTYTQS